jgi:phosphoenolpyruvate carboxykinase (ATP)
MSVPTIAIPTQKLLKIGLKASNNIHYQLSPEELVQDTLRSGEGTLNDTGALVINTGEFSGRCPKDKFTVLDEVTKDDIHWNEFNQAIDEKYFDIIFKKITTYLNQREEIWVLHAPIRDIASILG